MKKVTVFFIVLMVIFGACSVQRTEAQSSNIAQKIIGTWVEQGGFTWVFNSDGTGTSSNMIGNFKFAVAETKLAICSISLTQTIVLDISITSDGKTLILSTANNGGYWLTKK